MSRPWAGGALLNHGIRGRPKPRDLNEIMAVVVVTTGNISTLDGDNWLDHKSDARQMIIPDEAEIR